jgi:shikimate dehydrogenase
MGRPLLGVAGWPVSNSRSPAMQNAALTELGLDWLYVPVPLPPDLFADTVSALGGAGFRGLNVTVPHKVAAHDVADSLSEAASAIGAANTLTFGEGIEGDNTDAGGLLDALGEPLGGRSVLVLGAGGAARAAVWALLDAGAAEVSVWNRTAERAAVLASELGARAIPKPVAAEVVVNCTRVGLGGEGLEDLGLGGVDPGAVVVDMVYGAQPTPVQGWAESGGARFVSGLEVLVRQGARSLALWTGCESPVDVMRAAAARG